MISHVSINRRTIIEGHSEEYDKLMNKEKILNHNNEIIIFR